MDTTRQSTHVFQLTKIALCVALLCVSSYIAIPLPFTSVVLTAQTLVINVVALILTPVQSACAVGLYILLGICGLPVFAGGTAGIGRIIGPTGGFIVGFLVAAPVISAIKGERVQWLRYCLVTIAVGIPIIDFLGTAFMCWFQKMGIVEAVIAAVLQFLLGDVIKCIVASYLGFVLNKVLPRNNVMRGKVTERS